MTHMCFLKKKNNKDIEKWNLRPSFWRPCVEQVTYRYFSIAAVSTTALLV
jgi:hypothetical protein